MKKILSGVFLVGIIIFGFVFLRNTTSVTEALLDAYPNGISIIHEQEVEDGSIVMFRQNNLEERSLSFNYVKRDFLGNYKTTYNGTVDTEGMFERYGFAFMAMTNEVAIRQWDLASPSIIGLIENEAIAKITITNDSDTLAQEAEIIRVGDYQILFANLSIFLEEENIIIITAYNNNGEVIALIQE